MENYYQGTTKYPAHLSVGAVLLNDKQEVCTLHFNTISLPQYAHLSDFNILMRETIELGETLEQALARGLKEEFGAEGTIEAYLGSRKTIFEKEGVQVEKTTLFFLVQCKTFDPKKSQRDDVESEAEIVWVPFPTLKAKMRAQFERLHEEDINEAEMLERAEHYLEAKW